MSLMEHLDELRKRIVHSAIYLALGFIIAYVFHERLYGLVEVLNGAIQQSLIKIKIGIERGA